MKLGCCYAVGLLVLSTLASCNPAKPAPKTSGTGTGTATKIQPKDLLRSAFDSLQPEKLGITSDRQSAVKTLNDWANLIDATK